MKTTKTSLFLMTALLAGISAANPMPAFAADAPAAPAGKIETLVIGKVKVNDSIVKAATEQGRKNKLDQVSEAMSTQFQASLNGTRKFKLLVGADLNSIMDEHKKDPLLSRDNPDARTVGTLIPPKYVVVSTIDDFQDNHQKLNLDGSEMTARDIRISVVTTIYNINDGSVYETLNTQVKDRKAAGANPNVTQTGDSMDEMLGILTRKAAADSAQRVVDVFFPAKVISKVDKTIQINRGDGTNIAAGQIWDAVVQGAENKDPDTGEVLSRDEAPSGKVRITRVFPKYSTAEIIEDINIQKGDVLRLHEDKTDASKPK
jgi:hypothetical protein